MLRILTSLVSTALFVKLHISPALSRELLDCTPPQPATNEPTSPNIQEPATSSPDVSGESVFIEYPTLVASPAELIAGKWHCAHMVEGTPYGKIYGHKQNLG
jgi:hypothetical protein